MNRQHKTIKTNYNHLMILLKHRDSGLVESKGGWLRWLVNGCWGSLGDGLEYSLRGND